MEGYSAWESDPLSVLDGGCRALPQSMKGIMKGDLSPVMNVASRMLDAASRGLRPTRSWEQLADKDVDGSQDERHQRWQLCRLAAELDEEEVELWRQLRRKRDFEDLLLENREKLQSLRDLRQRCGAALADVLAAVDRLSDELAASTDHERELCNDVTALRESNRALQTSMQHSSFNVTLQHARTAAPVLDTRIVGKEENSAMLVQEQIEHMRGYLQKLYADKEGLLKRNQALLEKQRAAEQDRNRVLNMVYDDKKGIHALRAERIQLCEERCRMQRAITDLVRQSTPQFTNESRWASPPRPLNGEPTNGKTYQRSMAGANCGSSTVLKGSFREGDVRVPPYDGISIARITGPTALSSNARTESATSSTATFQDGSRTHWTRFDADTRGLK